MNLNLDMFNSFFELFSFHFRMMTYFSAGYQPGRFGTVPFALFRGERLQETQTLQTDGRRSEEILRIKPEIFRQDHFRSDHVAYWRS
jgi:hypothetical protein